MSQPFQGEPETRASKKGAGSPTLIGVDCISFILLTNLILLSFSFLYWQPSFCFPAQSVVYLVFVGNLYLLTTQFQWPPLLATLFLLCNYIFWQPCFVGKLTFLITFSVGNLEIRMHNVSVFVCQRLLDYTFHYKSIANRDSDFQQVCICIIQCYSTIGQVLTSPQYNDYLGFE